MDKKGFKLLAKELQRIQTREQFFDPAKNWASSPVSRDEFLSAIAFTNISFGHRCKFYKWFDECWRNR